MGMTWKIVDARPAAEIRSHYEIEKRLATQLRSAQKEERRNLYRSAYDELFRRVPNHPQLVNRATAEERQTLAKRQVGFLQSLTRSGPTFLEVGCGDCLISLEFAKHAAAVYAVDVSDEITKQVTPPGNFRLILSDGSSIDVPAGTVDLAFSNQLMEHLHPEDALDQLRNVYRALAAGGRYFCITPNRMSGPHDVSRNFDGTATCFHLKEYTVAELQNLFRQVGFRKFHAYIGVDGMYMRVPTFLPRLLEGMLSWLPDRLRLGIAPTAPFRLLLGIRLLAIK